MKSVSREPTRVDLVGAADTAPAHSVVVIVAALDGTAATLVMNENAANHLNFKKDILNELPAHSR